MISWVLQKPADLDLHSFQKKNDIFIRLQYDDGNETFKNEDLITVIRECGPEVSRKGACLQIRGHSGDTSGQ